MAHSCTLVNMNELVSEINRDEYDQKTLMLSKKNKSGILIV